VATSRRLIIDCAAIFPHEMLYSNGAKWLGLAISCKGDFENYSPQMALCQNILAREEER